MFVRWYFEDGWDIIFLDDAVVPAGAQAFSTIFCALAEIGLQVIPPLIAVRRFLAPIRVFFNFPRLLISPQAYAYGPQGSGP